MRITVNQLIKRNCPLCNSDNAREIVVLTQDMFTLNNESYDIRKIASLGLPSDIRYPIVKCNSCSMEYTQYHLDDVTEAKVYSDIIMESKSKAKILSLGRRKGDYLRWLKILNILNKNPKDELNLKILDYGCGWGSLLQVASGPGVKTIGYDMTSWKSEWANSNGVNIVSSEEELIENGPYDVVISTAVLEHLHDPMSDAKKLAYLLKDDGVALIDCDIFGGARLNNNAEWKIVNKNIHNNKMIKKEINPWEHHNYFTPKTFNQLMTTAGFSPVASKGEWLSSSSITIQILKYLFKINFPLKHSRFYHSGFWLKA